MKWITRARPKTDRIACPWLILRFIDPAAEILYVDPEQVLAVAARVGGHSFDAPGADYTHRPNPDGGQWCTFEALIPENDLGHHLGLTTHARHMPSNDTTPAHHTDRPAAPRPATCA